VGEDGEGPMTRPARRGRAHGDRAGMMVPLGLYLVGQGGPRLTTGDRFRRLAQHPEQVRSWLLPARHGDQAFGPYAL
jgi:hypothetical protein